MKKANQAAFLAAYERTATVVSAARAAGVRRSAHYEWLKDPEYASRFEETKRVALGILTEEAMRRAVTGVRKPRFYRGVPCMVPALDEDGIRKIDPETGEGAWEPYVEHRYSDVLLMFLMKAADPARYDDRLTAGRRNRAFT